MPRTRSHCKHPCPPLETGEQATPGPQLQGDFKKKTARSGEFDDRIPSHDSTRGTSTHGGATTTGPDATHPPSYLSKLVGGGQLGGGPAGGRGGGVLPGVGGGGVFVPGVGGGGLAGGQRGVQPVRGGGGLGLGSPSWWNQSWFYNPF